MKKIESNRNALLQLRELRSAGWRKTHGVRRLPARVGQGSLIAKKTAAFAAAIVVAFLLPSTTVRSQDARIEARFVRVGTPDVTSSNRAEAWRQALSNEMNARLIYSIDNMENVNDASYLESFKFSLSTSPDTLTIGEMDGLWQNRLLEVITGYPLANGTDVVMNTNIYIGALKGKLSHPLFNLNPTIRAANVRAGSEGIILITLYALAEDALSLGKSPAVSCHLLDQARGLIEDLVNRDPSSDPELPQIQSVALALRTPVEDTLQEKSCALPIF